MSYKPAGILKYVEDLIRGLNAGIGRKDFFEVTSNNILIHSYLKIINDESWSEEWVGKILGCFEETDGRWPPARRAYAPEGRSLRWDEGRINQRSAVGSQKSEVLRQTVDGRSQKADDG